jgi:hypothetical protein
MTAWFNALMQRRLIRRGAPLAILLLIVGALAAGTAIGNTATCSNTAATLAGSGFEIDSDANQVVDSSGCIDWLDTSTDPGTQQDAIVKTDTPSGNDDESFGNGTKEDTAEPSVVDGGIPPNKSDLKAFGVFVERTQGMSGFLELFWSRVQEPTGTTNMDFELNQKFCDTSATPTNCAPNGLTPLRTSGDKLITYDLDRGGTRATISIRTWDGSAWGPATVLTSENPPQALGTINTSQITAANSLVGALSPRTFGEASISFEALFGQGACGQFGSAYLKSRSSDSFTAALKDFVPPQRVDISNCPAGLTTTATSPVTIGEPISDTAHLDTGNTNPTGTITFHLFSDSQCQTEITTGLSPVTVNGDGSYNSGDYTPTAAGSYFWTASYSGDATHDPVSTACGEAGETSVVNKASPSISTTLSSESIEAGGTVHDSSTLSGATPDAGGTVTYTVYTNDTCTNEFADAGTKTVTNGVVPDSDPVTFNQAGDYYWQAVYSGDSNNNGATSVCTTEHLVVGKKSPSIATTLSDESIQVGESIHDSSTLSGATPDAGGTVTYTVYTDSSCSQGARDAGTKTVTNGVVPDSNTLQFDTPGDYYWQAVYSGDSNNNGAMSVCTSEHLVVGKAPSTQNTAQSFYPNDEATLSASAASGTPTGNVTFSLFDNDTCSGTTIYGPVTDDLSASGTASTSNTTFAISSTKTVYWKVEYEGDDKHEAVSSCTENTVLTIDNGGPVTSN